MQGIYTYIPETNYVPKEYSVAAILLLLFMVLISLVPVLNYYYYYYTFYVGNGIAQSLWWLRCYYLDAESGFDIRQKQDGFLLLHRMRTETTAYTFPRPMGTGRP